MVARSPLVSESARLARATIIGALLVSTLWFAGLWSGGVARFILTVVAVMAAAGTIALLVNGTIDGATDLRARKSLRGRFSASGPKGIRRCGTCRRIQMQASDVWVCPHCDDPQLG